MNKKHILPLVVSALFCISMSSTIAAGSGLRLEANRGGDNPVQMEVATKEITLSFPSKGQVIDILRPNVKKFIDAMHKQAEAIENDYVLHDFYVRATDDQENYGGVFSNETDLVRIDDYAKTNSESRSKNITLVFDHLGFEDETEFTVKVSEKEDLSDAKTIVTKNKYAVIINLKSNTTYYWQVSSGEVKSEISNFTTRDGFRMITANGVQNIRDMGGRLVEGGKRIKQGLIFRGGELVEEDYTAGGSTHHKSLYDGAKEVLQDDLGIKVEIDLRGDKEANYITESVLKDDTHADVEYFRIPDMAAYHYLLKKSKSYDNWPGIKNMFLAFKNANEKHVYFHCWGGADRTGTAGFLLGALLGMSMTDLVIDFELTSFAGNYRPHYKIDPNKVYHWPHLMYQLYNGSNMAPFRAEGKHLKDIVADYLKEYAGLTDQDIQDIRNNLLEDVE